MLRGRCLQVAPSVRTGRDCGGRCEELLCAWRLPRLCVGRTSAACAGRGVWGRESRLVYVGALCQPAKDPGRLDPCVQRWKASIEASVIIGDFLNTPQERGLKGMLEILCGELPGSVSALELLFSLRCGFAQMGRVWDAWAGLGWACSGAGRAEPKAAHCPGSRARTAGLCPSHSARNIAEFHTSAFYFGCSSVHLCSRFLPGWRQALGTKPRLSRAC